MKLRVNTLILEITRRCNMCCNHCLRGDDQGLGMNILTIRNLLHEIKDISSITFTGGEPSLAVSALHDIREYCEHRQIPVNSGFLATNGKRISDAFLNECDAWHLYCLSNIFACTDKQNIFGKEIEKLVRMISRDNDWEYGMCLALSIDQFHDEIPVENVLRLTSKSYFSESKFNYDHFEAVINGATKYSGIQRSGRAKEFLSDFAREHEPEIDTDWTLNEDIKEPILYVETLYVNAKGDILFDCDLSYDDQETYKIGNVNDEAWTDTLYAYLKQQKEKATMIKQWKKGVSWIDWER